MRMRVLNNTIRKNINMDVLIAIVYALVALSVGYIINYLYYNMEIIRVDGLGYYYYLQEWFIKNPLSLDEVGCDFVSLSDGTLINKYPIGVAICQIAFFLLTLACNVVGKQTISGWEWSFQITVLISGVFFFGLGVYCCIKAWQQYFERKIVLASVFFLVFGTRLFHYASVDCCLSHVYSFSVFSAMIYLLTVINKGKQYYYRYSLILGALSGLLIAIRNTNLLMVSFCICMLLHYFIARKLSFKFFFVNALLYIVTMIALFLPQMLYWFGKTGNFIMYSYGGESFDWKSPHILGVLLGQDAITGIVRSSPIIVFFVLYGIKCFIDNNLPNEWVIISFCVLGINLYVTASWWCWYSLSRRTYVDYLPLVVPFACTCVKDNKANKIVIMGLIIGVFFSVYKMYEYWMWWQ